MNYLTLMNIKLIFIYHNLLIIISIMTKKTPTDKPPERGDVPTFENHFQECKKKLCNTK